MYADTQNISYVRTQIFVSKNFNDKCKQFFQRPELIVIETFLQLENLNCGIVGLLLSTMLLLTVEGI